MSTEDSPRTPSRRRGALAAALASLALSASAGVPARAQDAPAAPDQGGFSIERAEVTTAEDGSQTIEIEGAVPVPNGIRVQVGIVYAGETAHVTPAEVIAERFSVKIPVTGSVVPDEYDVQIALSAQQPRRATRGLDPEKRKRLTEPVTHKVRLGPADASPAEARETARSRLGELLDEARAIFAGMIQADALIRQNTDKAAEAEAQAARSQGRRPRPKHQALPPPVLASLREAWEDARSSYIDGRFETLERRLSEHRAQLFMHPLPTAASGLEALLVALEKWLNAVVIDTHADLGLEPPANGKKQLPRGVLLAKVLEQSKQIYGYLEQPEIEWLGQQVPTDRRDGRITEDGKTYVSWVRTFEISLPGEGWRFDLERRRSTLAIAMRPPENAPTGALIAVEVEEHPEASSFEDLAKRSWDRAAPRIPGYKEIARSPVEKPDATLESGKRLGGDHTFRMQPEGKGEEKAPAYWVRYFELYGKDHRRLYRVVCITPFGTEDQVKEAFEKACASLRLLDGKQTGEAGGSRSE